MFVLVKLEGHIAICKQRVHVMMHVVYVCMMLGHREAYRAACDLPNCHISACVMCVARCMWFAACDA